MYEGLGELSRLSCLQLDFDQCESSLWAFDKLAQLPVFPALENLRLEHCHMWVEDFSAFILKHRDTLKSSRIFSLELWDGSTDDFRVFLQELRTSPKLGTINWFFVALDGDQVVFPWVGIPWLTDMDDEDGYVLVDATNQIVLIGPEEVEEGLRLMAECMRIA